MAEALINVIVPIFNVECYLRKCVDSILSQTHTSLRVILVDDGSTDNCGEICNEYAKRDSRVMVIHRPNGGLSAARNSGLSALIDGGLSGDYIAFVDSDDCITPDYIKFLYNLLSENNADIAQCGHYVTFSEARAVDKDSNHGTIVFNRRQAIESLCYNDSYDVTVWNKLYRRAIFQNIRFPEGRIYEDTAVSYLIVEQAETFVVNMSPKYYYLQRYDSTANSIKFDARKYQFVEVGDEMADYIAEHYPELAEAANTKRVFVRLSTLSQMVNSKHYDKQRISEMKRVINHYRVSMLLDGKVSKRDKLGIVALTFGFPVYRAVWGLYYKIVRRQ